MEESEIKSSVICLHGISQWVLQLCYTAEQQNKYIQFLHSFFSYCLFVIRSGLMFLINPISAERSYSLFHSLNDNFNTICKQLKNPPTNAGDINSIPESGRLPAGGYGNPVQYSCLEDPMDRRAWRAIVHRVAKSQTQLSN